jgi:hypothetical protein
VRASQLSSWHGKSLSCFDRDKLANASITSRKTISLDQLTGRNNNPDEIHCEVIDPEVKRFRSAIRPFMNMIVIYTSREVERIAVKMGHANDYLQRVTHRVIEKDRISNSEA